MLSAFALNCDFFGAGTTRARHSAEMYQGGSPSELGDGAGLGR